MRETDIFISLILVFFGGSIIGLYFNFSKGQSLKQIPFNMFLALTGICLGLISASVLPILPKYKLDVAVALALLTSIHFMIGHWMISSGTTPIVRYFESYRMPYNVPMEREKIKKPQDIFTKVPVKPTTKPPENLPAA